MKVLSVVGARPQFIKAAIVCRALESILIDQVMVHTGQHYDENMSRIFFDQMGIPSPDYNLNVGSGSHAAQTGQAMERLELICESEKPDAVIVYGDTNATLSGALVAAKLNIPIAHVEAGLRSFDRMMPEEINRVVVDHVSDILFCPTVQAVQHLEKEGIVNGVYNVGDVMYDATLQFRDIAIRDSNVLNRLGLIENEYILVTIHRNFNTDSPQRLRGIVEGLRDCNRPIVFPAHPRVLKQMQMYGLTNLLRDSDRIKLVSPVGYLDMIRLELSAFGIITDSGGVQKEAFFLDVPCLTVRSSSEWLETVEAGWNRLIEPKREILVDAVADLQKPLIEKKGAFGDGNAGHKIATILSKRLSQT